MGSESFAQAIPEPVWKTRDGRRLTVGEMSEQHLVNARAYMLRKIATGAPHFVHACFVDIMDGPCAICDFAVPDERQIREHRLLWIDRLDAELCRRYKTT